MNKLLKLFGLQRIPVGNGDEKLMERKRNYDPLSIKTIIKMIDENFQDIEDFCQVATEYSNRYESDFKIKKKMIEMIYDNMKEIDEMIAEIEKRGK